MQGLELVKHLAERDRELVTKLEETRRCADGRIANAKEKARRIMNEADIQIRQMSEASKARITGEGNKLAEEAHTRAEAEADRLRRQADSHIDRAVGFILSEVLP
jgi:vacuolar-type H+-ATPase subunit H